MMSKDVVFQPHQTQMQPVAPTPGTSLLEILMWGIFIFLVLIKLSKLVLLFAEVGIRSNFTVPVT